MKCLNLSKRVIILLSILGGMIILCGTFYLGYVSGINKTDNNRIVTHSDLSPVMHQKIEQQIKLKEDLINFNNNIVDASAYLEISDDGRITGANIFIVVQEDITDEDELMLLVSESLSLDTKDIHIKFMNNETYLGLETEW